MDKNLSPGAIKRPPLFPGLHSRENRGPMLMNQQMNGGKESCAIQSTFALGHYNLKLGMHHRHYNLKLGMHHRHYNLRMPSHSAEKSDERAFRVWQIHSSVKGKGWHRGEGGFTWSDFGSHELWCRNRPPQRSLCGKSQKGKDGAASPTCSHPAENKIDVT